MGWIVDLIVNLWTTKKTAAVAGIGAGLSGVVVLTASAAYSDRNLEKHVKDQDKVNSRVERNMETYNQNLFKLQLTIIEKKKYELEELEKAEAEK